MNHAPIDDLRKVFSYNPDSGVVTWIANRGGAQVGIEAGRKHRNGYRYIEYKGKRFRTHRLAWALYHGAWPEDQIDHINMDRSDNRLSNLRPASGSENNCNRTKCRTNTSGYKGVCFHKNRNKYIASIKLHGKQHFLGYFPTPIEASVAYEKAAKELHGEFSRTNLRAALERKPTPSDTDKQSPE